MSIFKYTLGLLLLFCLNNIFAITPNVKHADSKDVLLVLSYQATHRWTNDIVNAIQSESQYSPLLVRFNIVEMDSMRTNDIALQEKEFLETLNDIKAGNYDAIVAIDEEALSLVLKYYDKIPRTTNIVFSGIETYSSELRLKYPNITGVVQHYDVAGTIDNGLKL